MLFQSIQSIAIVIVLLLFALAVAQQPTPRLVLVPTFVIPTTRAPFTLQTISPTPLTFKTPSPAVTPAVTPAPTPAPTLPPPDVLFTGIFGRFGTTAAQADIQGIYPGIGVYKIVIGVLYLGFVDRAQTQRKSVVSVELVKLSKFFYSVFLFCALIMTNIVFFSMQFLSTHFESIHFNTFDLVCLSSFILEFENLTNSPISVTVVVDSETSLQHQLTFLLIL
jgi:hypothetical protein